MSHEEQTKPAKANHDQIKFREIESGKPTQTDPNQQMNNNKNK